MSWEISDQVALESISEILRDRLIMHTGEKVYLLSPHGDISPVLAWHGGHPVTLHPWCGLQCQDDFEDDDEILVTETELMAAAPELLDEYKADRTQVIQRHLNI